MAEPSSAALPGAAAPAAALGRADHERLVTSTTTTSRITGSASIRAAVLRCARNRATFRALEAEHDVSRFLRLTHIAERPHLAMLTYRDYVQDGLPFFAAIARAARATLTVVIDDPDYARHERVVLRASAPIHLAHAA